MTERTLRAPARHNFFLSAGPGKKRIKAQAKVIRAKKTVRIRLTEDDIIHALALDGRGDGNNCAGAVCVNRNRDAFPHKLVGYTEFLANSAYVGSRVGENGLPTQAYYYTHHSKIVQMFDDPAKLRTLLEKIRKDGPITITLYRPRPPAVRFGKPRGPHTTERGAQRGGLKKRWFSARLTASAAAE